MKNAEFSLDKIIVIEDADRLVEDQLDELKGGADPDKASGDCKCFMFNTNGPKPTEPSGPTKE